MNGLIGLVLLFGIALFIGGLGVWSRVQRQGVMEFYKKHCLSSADDVPPLVRASLGQTPNPICLRGSLTTKSGEVIPFYWWEWFTTTRIYTGQSSQTAINSFLAISFPPFTISEDSEKRALDAMQKHGAMEKLKGAFGLDMYRPIRAERLNDGSFLICWRIVQRAKMLEERLLWLQDNMALHPLKNMKATFYKHDTYSGLRLTFQTAWPNLSLELNHASSKFYKEGWDEFDENTIQPDLTAPNAPLFSLDDEDSVEKAMRLFSDTYGAEAYILRDGVSVENRESLAYCNAPFTLRLNEYTYGEFKRRFTEQWPSLSIALYDSSPNPGDLGRNNREFADDFDMKSLKNGGGLLLRDYTYILDWVNLLKNTHISAMIRSEKLGFWERSSPYWLLKEFQSGQKH